MLRRWTIIGNPPTVTSVYVTLKSVQSSHLVLSKYVPMASGGIPRDEGSLRFGWTVTEVVSPGFPPAGRLEVPSLDESFPPLASFEDCEVVEEWLRPGLITRKKMGKTTAAATRKTRRTAHRAKRVLDFDVGFSKYGSGTLRAKVGIRSSEK